MVRSLLLAVVLFTIVACRPPEAQSPAAGALARLAESKSLRVGYIVFPPCVTKNMQDGSLSGHCVATVEAIAQQAGWKVEYIETNWATFSSGLSTGQFDVSIAPTFVTVPRALSVSFTRPLFYAGNSAIGRKGESRFPNIQSLDQANVTVAVTDGEAGHEYAKANFKNAKLIVHSGSDQSLAFHEVLAGRADVALGDAYVTGQFANTHPTEIDDLFAKDPYNLTPVAWSLKQGDSQFLEFLNASLDALDSQGKLLEFERSAQAHWLHIEKNFRVY